MVPCGARASSCGLAGLIARPCSAGYMSGPAAAGASCAAALGTGPRRWQHGFGDDTPGWDWGPADPSGPPVGDPGDGCSRDRGDELLARWPGAAAASAPLRAQPGGCSRGGGLSLCSKGQGAVAGAAGCWQQRAYSTGQQGGGSFPGQLLHPGSPLSLSLPPAGGAAAASGGCHRVWATQSLALALGSAQQPGCCAGVLDLLDPAAASRRPAYASSSRCRCALLAAGAAAGGEGGPWEEEGEEVAPEQPELPLDGIDSRWAGDGLE